jgi:2-polyprenyl-3-methyl-5-hydroxy-6-metoxy-1,4-benzoquinol methylase
MVGCGNSKLSEEMAADGYPWITNMDISECVLNKMVD